MTDLLAALDLRLLARTLVGIVVLLGVVAVLQRWAGLGLGWAPTRAVLRAVLQLGLASLVLSGVLSVPWTAVLVLALMLTTASWTSGGRLGGLADGRRAATLGVVAGGVTATAAVLLLGMVPWTTRSLVAIGGILIGSAMTASTLAGRHFRTLAEHRAGEIEAWWALGASSPQAFADVGREAVRDALVPNLDQTRSTGLVTLPGAFIGALFGGASPLEAARFQVVVLVGIMLAQTVAAVVVTRVLGRMRGLPAGV